MLSIADIGLVLFLSLAVSNVSMVMTKTGIFRPYRDFFERRYQNAVAGSKTEKFWHFWHELTTCPYCTSHWITFPLIALYQPRPLHSSWLFIDLTVAAFASITLSAWWSGLIYRAFAGMGHGKEDEEP